MENRQNGRLTLGRNGEDIAADYLKRLRYRLLARSFRLGRGEIDIVARDGATIVFIEVKTRTDSEHGPPEEAVTAAKQAQIRKVAEGFLIRRRVAADTPCRFDVLSVRFGDGGLPIVHHIKDAF